MVVVQGKYKLLSLAGTHLSQPVPGGKGVSQQQAHHPILKGVGVSHALMLVFEAPYADHNLHLLAGTP
eukprot:1158876-Pelagomonas_calceolata.AAC.4